MTKFAGTLKSLRLSKDLTQDDLAQKLNITKAAVSNYENGRRLPDYETLELIADYFNVNMDFLLGRTSGEEDILMTIGEVIRQYRIKNKITMAEFAEKSNLSKGYISMLENNRNPQNKRALVPSVETFNKVADAMGISIEELISITNKNQPIELNSNSKNELSYFNELFSSNLLRLLDKCNLTQKEVADKIGVSPQTFNTWCKGIALPRMDKVDALARYFNVPRSELISEPSKVDRNVAESPPKYTYHSEELEALIAIFNKINIQGQQKILVYANDLLQSGLYKKSSHIQTAEIA